MAQRRIGLPVAYFLEEAWRDRRARYPKYTTAFSGKLSRLQDRFGAAPPGEVTAEAIDAYCRDRAASGTPLHAIMLEVRILLRALDRAVKLGIIPAVPNVALDWNQRFQTLAAKEAPAVPDAVRTVEDLLQLHRRDLILSGRKEYALRNDFARKRLAEFFGHRDPRDMKARDIDAYKAARLAQGAARATINNELAALRRAFRLAVEYELLERAPSVRLFAERDCVIREGFLTPEKFHELRATLEALNPIVADMVACLYYLGWRRREIAETTWDLVDLEANPPTLSLPAMRSKNRSPRRIPIPAEVERILRRRRKTATGPFVFARSDGRRVKTFLHTWRRALKARGLGGLLIHDLRRSFVHAAIQSGAALKTIMDCGGWKTLRMVNRYAIVDEGMIAEGLKKVQAYILARQPKPANGGQP
jgi:integrase